MSDAIYARILADIPDNKKTGREHYLLLPDAIQNKISQYFDQIERSQTLWASHASTIEGEAVLIGASDAADRNATAIRQEIDIMAQEQNVPLMNVARAIAWMSGQPDPLTQVRLRTTTSPAALQPD